MKDNPGEYYYPVQTLNSKIIYEKYKKLSRKKKIYFLWRTGLFKYIDMIPVNNTFKDRERFHEKT